MKLKVASIILFVVMAFQLKPFGEHLVRVQKIFHSLNTQQPAISPVERLVLSVLIESQDQPVRGTEPGDCAATVLN